MHEELVKIYNDELNDLREKGEVFADENPKIASRLKLAKGSIEDPLVGRLLESFAFLTARLRYQMHAEFKQLDYQMAQLLYPHFFLPLPAYTTLQMRCDEKVKTGIILPAKTVLSTPLPSHEMCHFSSVYPVTVQPLKITKIRYQRDPIIPVQKMPQNQLKSCLTFTLESSNPQVSIGDMLLENIRLFLNFDTQKVGKTYELLTAHVKEISIRADSQEKAINFPVENLQPVGFETDEMMLPYPSNSFSGYRLLTEYFAYPDKFHYINFKNLKDYIADTANQSVTFYLFFDIYFNDLEDVFMHDTLLLNCVPVINLFETRGNVINFNHMRREYQVIPDGHYNAKSIEVYLLNELNVSTENLAGKIDCLPYFSRKMIEVKDNYLYWSVQRKSCSSLGKVDLEGDEVFIDLSDVKVDEIINDIKLVPRLICTNRNAAIHLPFGGGKPDWTFNEFSISGIAAIQCVKPIVGAKYRRDTAQLRAELVQHIYSNQVGLIDGKLALHALQTILKLYAFGEQQGRDIIESGILDVSTRPMTIRHPDSLHQGICRGMEYRKRSDEMAFKYQNIYLLGSVIHDFLSKSCSVNSFVTLLLESTQRGVIQQWKPILGKKATL